MVKNTKMLLAEIKSEGKGPKRILLVDILPTSGPRWHQKVLGHLNNALIEALEHQRKERYTSNYFRKYNPGYFRRLLLAGASPNAKGSAGTRALQYAAEAGDAKICAMLLENGANPNMKDNIGLTSLHSAVYHNKIRICKLLLENGANPNIKDNSGETPMEMAKRHGRTEILKILKAARAKKAGST